MLNLPIRDIIMALFLQTPQQIALHLGKSAQVKRLALNLSQKSLAERSGVSLGVLKKFEHTGKISLESLLKLALVLECLEKFHDLFKIEIQANSIRSLDDLFKDQPRKRGRK
jgi:transcriptional regulator with XRE-family HTH domain